MAESLPPKLRRKITEEKAASRAKKEFEGIKTIEDAFAFCDKDGDGVISKRELGQALSSLGEHKSDEELQELMNRVDADGSGTLDFDEFACLVKTEKPIHSRLVKGRKHLMAWIGDCAYAVSSRVGRGLGFFCRCFCCCHANRYRESPYLPANSELGTRDEALRALGACARLVGGTGYIDAELHGKFDPPLIGKHSGFKIESHVDQICETSGSTSAIQAACYTNARYPKACIVAFRGTMSYAGLKQDATLLTPYKGTPIYKACKQSCKFVKRCQENHEGKTIFVTGLSLGGYLAEVVASKLDVAGASFNSPGPWRWHLSMIPNNAGHERPPFEIHLTRSDRVANILFPKPQHSTHIGRPLWHHGKVHRICDPYVPDEVVGIPSGIKNQGDTHILYVNQKDELGIESSTSESSTADSSSDESGTRC
ncbi:unnamed protein product [Prorocentrum cordatum]|uniref:EF-hand domain-containing protein n=1 Tax=Prorocentrum cordatum TaxID=2364126 RepID=A0ABN9V7X3_9DINO|nr:unnamed protein product [Polarella glacialis]|mmetsp:Transcript_48510/g.129457  ORF Transcript_48510/g.129457 Transcript_48510/m.129457 type:complete len:425 (-) Transcript_48510:251-1525(-)